MKQPWPFVDMMRQKPEQFISRVIRSVARNGTLADTDGLDVFLTAEINTIASGLKISGDLINDLDLNRASKKIDAAIILQLMIEKLIDQEAQRCMSQRMLHKRVLARGLIGMFILHARLFGMADMADESIRGKYYWSTLDVQLRFQQSTSSSDLLNYFATNLISHDAQNALMAYLSYGHGNPVDGAEQFLNMAFYVSIKTLENDLHYAMKKLATTILRFVGSLSEQDPGYEEEEGIFSATSTNEPVEELMIGLQLATGLGYIAQSDFSQPSGERVYRLNDVTAPYVEPDFILTNYMAGQKRDITLEQIINLSGRYIITSPPWGGKTLLQREMAIRNRQKLSIFIDMEDFSRSGISDIFTYTARNMRAIWAYPSWLLHDIRDKLEIMDQSCMIVWHLDRWDAIEPAARAASALSITPLQTWFIATVDPESIRSHLRESDIDNPDSAYVHGEIKILAFTQEKIDEFIELFRENIDEQLIEADRWSALTKKLPGMASHPGVLRLIMEQPIHLPLLDVIRGTITNKSVLHSAKNLAYLALGPRPVDTLVQMAADDLHEIYITKSQIMQELQSMARNDFSKVTMWIHECTRGGVLHQLDDDQFLVVLPELWFLLAAEIVCNRNGLDIVTPANRVYNANPTHPMSRIMMVYAIQRLSSDPFWTEWILPV